MTKSVLITGITGQDGAYLAKILLKKNYDVFGIYRRLSSPNFWRLQHLEIFDAVHLIPADLIDAGSVIEALKISKPTEIYNLAAQSFVGASFEQPIATGDISGLGVTRILESVRQVDKSIRVYQASSSEIYGNGNANWNTLNEKSVFEPASPYAAAKLYGYWMTDVYREGHHLFASNGILFNHESPLRGLEFVTRKVTNAAARIALGEGKTLSLGNLDAKRDWGYAPDYVEAMWLMLQQEEADNYVVATGESHSVKELAEIAFSELGLDWTSHVKYEPKLLRPLDVKFLQGDFSKAKKKLGWEPKVKFSELVRIMVKQDLNRWERWQKGERFPWDAPHYPDESRIISRYLAMDE